MTPEQLGMLKTMPRADRIAKYLPILIAGGINREQYDFIIRLPYTPVFVAHEMYVEENKKNEIEGIPQNTGGESGDISEKGKEFGGDIDGRDARIVEEIAKNLGSG